MRGSYYSDIVDRVRENNEVSRLARETADKTPQVIAGPDTVSQPEDVRAIVAYVAHQIFRGDLEYHGLEDLSEGYPALKGLTWAQIDAALTEALA
jgi:hypothetical protein